MKWDLHCHTIYSKHWFWGFDALNKPREIVKAAIKRGLDGLAITDHNTVKGSLIAKNIAKRYKNFSIITGSEIKTLCGDLIALGIKSDIPKKITLEETIEKIHDLGGIAIAPHPFGIYLFRRCLSEKAIKADAIEVFNASITNGANKKALDLAKRFRIPKTASSDAHWIKNVGNAGVICENPLEDIIKNRAKLFCNRTPYRDIAQLAIKKFKRSIKWRILRVRKYL